MRVAIFILLFGLLVGTAGEANAKTAKEQANEHVIAGDDLNVRGKKARDAGSERRAKRLFEKALKEFESAYNIIPHPEVLFNIALLSSRTGDDERALKLFKELLDSGDKAVRLRVKEELKLVEDRLAEKARTGGDDDDDDDPLPDDDDDDYDDDDDDDPLPDYDDDDDDDDDDDGRGNRLIPAVSKRSSGGGSVKRYAGLGLVAAGFVSIGIGAKFGLDAKSISDCLTNYPMECDDDFPQGWTDRALALEEEGESANTKMLIFYGAGVAALLGGGYLYFSGTGEKRSARERASLRVAPSIGPEGLGVSLTSSF